MIMIIFKIIGNDDIINVDPDYVNFFQFEHCSLANVYTKFIVRCLLLIIYLKNCYTLVNSALRIIVYFIHFFPC